MFKSYGATERTSSSQQTKFIDPKTKKELAKNKHSNRETINRSALNGSSEFTGISLGRSPDRSKNLSVYSHGPTGNLLAGPNKTVIG